MRWSKFSSIRYIIGLIHWEVVDSTYSILLPFIIIRIFIILWGIWISRSCESKSACPLKYQVIWVVVSCLWSSCFDNWWWVSVWWLYLFVSLCMYWLCLECWSECQSLPHWVFWVLNVVNVSHTFIGLSVLFTPRNNPHWCLIFIMNSTLCWTCSYHTIRFNTHWAHRHITCFSIKYTLKT